ncbi:MAG TPA: FecR domain-containing protein [Bdellovibrionota bacterium]
MSPALALASAGKIEKVGMGEGVKVSRSGSAIKLKEGDALESGDELTTDASTAVDIRLEDETLIRVGVNSTYKIQEESGAKALVHRLLSGVVRVLVKPTDRDGKKEANIKFRMYTPEGTIGVRGTEFVVLRTAGNTQIRGIDGSVMFGPAETDFGNDAMFVNVTKGFGSSITAGGKPGKLEKFDLKSYLEGLGARNGMFGPLAGRVNNVKTYARAAPQPFVPQATSSNPFKMPTPVVAAAPKEKKKEEKPAKVDYQVMLVKAILDEDVDDMGKALKGGADVNAIEPKTGVTMIEMAMTADKMAVYEKLIGTGKVDVNKPDNKGNTPLMYVAQEKLPIIYAKLLVDPSGANYAVENKKTGKSASDIAKANGYQELFDYLESDEIANDYLKSKK